MNTYLRNSIVIVVVLVSGVAIGRFTLPAKIVEKEKIVYQEKIVEKLVENKDSKQKDHKTYVKVETIAPDGSIRKETRILHDKDSEDSSQVVSDKTSDITATKEKEKTVQYKQQSTLLSLIIMSQANIPLSLSPPSYGLSVQQRIIGPFYVGGLFTTDRHIGLSLGIGF